MSAEVVEIARVLMVVGAGWREWWVVAGVKTKSARGSITGRYLDSGLDLDLGLAMGEEEKQLEADL